MNNLQSSKLLGLVVLFIMLLIHSCQVDVIEDLESVGEQAGEGCLMQISGTVINTKNLQPVANAELEANFFNATTDENGEFFIELYRSNVDESDIVKVRKEGYISNTFVVDYTEIAENNDCEEALSVGWSLSLSEEKAALQLDPETNGVFEFKDTIAFSEINEAGVTEILQDVNNYAVHITSGTVDKSTSISISPNHTTAAGMGIKFSENTFSSHRLDILSLNGTQIADNPNETTFQKPISVILGDADEIGEATLNTISILNLNATHSESIATAKVEDGQLAFEVLSTGRLFLAQNEALHQHAVDIFQAIEDGKSKEVNDLVKTAHRSGSTTISINSDNLCPGDLVRSKLYTNCNCGSTRWRRYQAGTNIWSNVHIQFPSGTSNRKRRKAYYALYDYFNTGYGRIRVNYYVKVLKCSQVRVKTREIIRKSEGSICGFPFSYEALHGLLTTAQLEDCPITSQCHQGCSH